MLSTFSKQWNLSDVEIIKYAIKFFDDTFEDFVEQFGMAKLTVYLEGHIRKYSKINNLYIAAYEILPNGGLGFLKRVPKEDLIIDGLFWSPYPSYYKNIPSSCRHEDCEFLIELYGDLDKKSFKDHGIHILYMSPNYFSQKYKDDDMIYRMLEKSKSRIVAMEMAQANLIGYRSSNAFYLLGILDMMHTDKEMEFLLSDYDINYTYKGKNLLQTVLDKFPSKEIQPDIKHIIILLEKYVKAGEPFDIVIPDAHYKAYKNETFEDLGVESDSHTYTSVYTGENEQHRFSRMVKQYPLQKLIPALKAKLKSDMQV